MGHTVTISNPALGGVAARDFTMPVPDEGELFRIKHQNNIGIVQGGKWISVDPQQYIASKFGLSYSPGQPLTYGSPLNNKILELGLTTHGAMESWVMGDMEQEYGFKSADLQEYDTGEMQMAGINRTSGVSLRGSDISAALPKAETFAAAPASTETITGPGAATYKDLPASQQPQIAGQPSTVTAASAAGATPTTTVPSATTPPDLNNPWAGIPATESAGMSREDAMQYWRNKGYMGDFGLVTPEPTKVTGGVSLSQLQEGKAYKDPNSARIYVMEGGSLQWIPDEETYKQRFPGDPGITDFETLESSPEGIVYVGVKPSVKGPDSTPPPQTKPAEDPSGEAVDWEQPTVVPHPSAPAGWGVVEGTTQLAKLSEADAKAEEEKKIAEEEEAKKVEEEAAKAEEEAAAKAAEEAQAAEEARTQALEDAYKVIDDALAAGIIDEATASLWKETVRAYPEGMEVNPTEILSTFEKIKAETIDPHFRELTDTAIASFTLQQSELEKARSMEQEMERTAAGQEIRQMKSGLEKAGMTFTGKAIEELGAEAAYPQYPVTGALPGQEPVGGLFYEGNIAQRQRLLAESSQARYEANLAALGLGMETTLGTGGMAGAGFTIPTYTPVGGLTGELATQQQQEEAARMQQLITQSAQKEEAATGVTFQ